MMNFRIKPLLFVSLFLLLGFGQWLLANTVVNVQFFGKLPLSEKELKQALRFNQPFAADQKQIAQKTTALVALFAQKGYLQVTVDSVLLHPLTPDSSQFELRYWITPGPLFKIKQIQVKSDSIKPVLYENLMELKAGKAFDQTVLQNDLQNILKFAAENGFPFAQARLTKVQTQVVNKQGQVEVTIQVREGPAVFIKEVVLTGLNYTRPQVVLRQIYFKPGMRFRQSWFNKMGQRIQRLHLFEQIGVPKMVRLAPDSIAIIQPLKEGSATSFDGVVGYVPPPANQEKEQGYLTGLIDISFRNLFGTGRKFKIFWEKTDRLSENFNFQYREPWLFSFPLDAGLSFSREVRDTLFITYNLKLNAQFNFNESFSLFVTFNRQSVNPDSLAAFRLSMTKNRVYGIESGVIYDTRDYPLNPRTGVFYQSSYSYGLKQNLGPQALLLRDSLAKNTGLNSLSMGFEWYRPLFKNQVMAVKFNLKNIKGSHLQLSDYFWFGGSASVRGYREKQFNGYLISWLNWEYRFLVGRNSRVFLFSDFGYYKTRVQNVRKEAFLRGMGFGLRFETPMGIMGVDYGLAKGESFRQGKIHVRLTSQF